MSVTDDAIEAIKAMITEGELRPGDRLPREPDLAERLGLSRNSLREAVRALSAMKVLDVRQGDGTYVTALDASLLMNAMAFVVDFHRDDVSLQFMEVRRILEPVATAKAALAMTDAEIERLEAMLDALGQSPSVEELVASDAEFHSAIARSGGNAILCSILESFTGPTQRARTWRGITQDEAVARTLSEHRSILGAIAARNPEAAQSWATIHVTGVEDWIRQSLRSDDSTRGHLSPVPPSS